LSTDLPEDRCSEPMNEWYPKWFSNTGTITSHSQKEGGEKKKKQEFKGVKNHRSTHHATGKSILRKKTFGLHNREKKERKGFKRDWPGGEREKFSRGWIARGGRTEKKKGKEAVPVILKEHEKKRSKRGMPAKI